MLRVLIADDHALLRNGIVKILREHFYDIIFSEANNTKEIFNILSKIDSDIFDSDTKQAFDFFIIDINMPGRNGLEAIKDLRKWNPNIPILVLSMYPEDEFALRAFKAGASGYLMKDTAPENLIIAVEKIMNGKMFITPTVAELLANEVQNSKNKKHHNKITDRELEVMLLIAEGKSVSQIAAELSLSVKTISTYRTHILQKLNLKNNAEIMRHVIDKKKII